jgi:signal transduction histidine kinase
VKGPASRLGRDGLALVALIAATGGVVTVFAPRPGTVVVASSATSHVVAWVLLGAVAALVAAGAVAWLSRPGSTLALIALWTAAAWTAPELVGSDAVPDAIRAVARLIGPLLIPLAAHLALRAVQADHGRARWVLGALYVAVAVLSIGHAITWDAFLVIDCVPFCRHDNPLALAPDLARSLSLRTTWAGLSAVAGLALAAWSVRHLRSRRDAADRGVLASSAATGVALAAVGIAIVRAPGPLAVDPSVTLTTVLLGAALAMLGATVSVARLRSAGRAVRLRRLVELMDADAGEAPLQATLAQLLSDPSVDVAYPVDHEWIDEQGRPVLAPTPAAGRALLTIARGGQIVAVVGHASGLDPELLASQVGAAARLAVDNERLAASLRARVRQLTESRARIVAAGDAARRRLERDLHDGAQQGLLAVSYELRLAAAAAPDDPRQPSVGSLMATIDRALAELRDLAHGIWPAVLVEAGLEAALRSLADDAPIPVTLDGIPEERVASASEAAAYLAVTDALGRAATAGGTTLVVTGRRVGDTLRLEVRVPGPSLPGPWLRVDDRVGAAGGRSAVSVDAAGTLLTVELPCA